jgi:hypothetical protein
MKKLFASLALAAAVAPVWAATQTVTPSGSRHDLRRLPDHSQESALQGRRREQGRCGLREARGRRHF